MAAALGGGGRGRGPSERSVRADRPGSPSVSAEARSDWRREADPQVFFAHRGAGRREGDQSSSVPMKSPQHTNETATSCPWKQMSLIYLGCKNTRSLTEDARVLPTAHFCVMPLAFAPRRCLPVSGCAALWVRCPADFLLRLLDNFIAARLLSPNAAGRKTR